MALAGVVSRSFRALLCAARSTVRPQQLRKCSTTTKGTTTAKTTASTTCSTSDGCDGSLGHQTDPTLVEATATEALTSQPVLNSATVSADPTDESDCSTHASPSAEQQLGGSVSANIEEPPPILADVPTDQPPQTTVVDVPKPAVAKSAAKKAAEGGGMRVNMPPNRLKNPAMSKSTLADAVAALKRQNGSDMRIIEVDGMQQQPAKEKP